jgi:hypothetical protein
MDHDVTLFGQTVQCAGFTQIAFDDHRAVRHLMSVEQFGSISHGADDFDAFVFQVFTKIFTNETGCARE